MTVEEEAVVKAVTAKLTGQFYIGQRVRCRQVGMTGGVITGFGADSNDFAYITPDVGRDRALYLWALEPA